MAETAEGGWILASEPLDAETLVWTAIAPDSLLTLSRDGVRRTPLELRLARAA